VPLSFGTNTIELVAFNFRGLEVGRDAITVVTSASEYPERDYLRISEIMYHPAAPSPAELTAGFTDRGDFEFIGLINIGFTNLSLRGVRFTTGIAFDFTTAMITDIALAGRVVLVSNRAAFEFRYGTNLPVAGEYSGNLSNGGEQLRLIDGFGGTIHEFSYGDGGAWPKSADGGGRSLSVLHFAGDYNAPSNWQESLVIGGTPGRAQPSAPVIDSITLTGQEIQLSFQAEPSLRYEVYGTDDLSSESWTSIRQIPARVDSRTEQVTDVSSSGSRFYRISSF